MPIQIEDLLKPISADQPSGVDLRYSPIADEIREARRLEDDVAQGVWKRDVKAADYARVITLTRDSLTKKTKDLQFAGWLTEALLAREGFRGLQQGLELIQRLLTDFWETVWPQIDEDGDLEMRATPLRWVGSQLLVLVRAAPITQPGVNWLRYKESRTLPTEEEANSNSDKAQARQEGIEDGRLTPEEWIEALNASPLAYYDKLAHDLFKAEETLAALSSFCDERFAEDPPDFGPLRTALEDVGGTVRILLISKGGRPPGDHASEEPPAEEPAYEAVAEPQYVEAGSAAAAAPRMARAPQSAGAEPRDTEDAIQRIITAAHFLRRENVLNPVPYLVLRALRWGEIRNSGIYADASLAEAPPSQSRVELKRLANEGDLQGVINVAENAMAQPCGRAWLDLQRYVVRACRNMGNENVANAICAELRALIADYPFLPKWTMMDDTPVANAETLEWMAQERILPEERSAAEAPTEAAAPPQQVYYSPPPLEVREAAEGATENAPDAQDVALEAARMGRVDEALEIMAREVRQAPSGRARFLRRVQLAQICLAAGKTSIAAPVLRELAGEIEHRGLESWESSDVVAQPLGLLYRCLAGDEDARKLIYERVCRLDPVRALALGG